MLVFLCVTAIGNPKEVRLKPPPQTCGSEHGDLVLEPSVHCCFSVRELCRLESSSELLSISVGMCELQAPGSTFSRKAMISL